MYATAAWLVYVLASESGVQSLLYVFSLLLLVGLTAWWAGRIHRWPYRLALLLIMTMAAISLLMPLAPQPPAKGSAEAFSETRLAELRAMQIPVLVNATADWCITCKVNERVALSSEKSRRSSSPATTSCC